MTKDVQNILSAIMSDVLQQIHEILASKVGINTKVGHNTLEGSDLDHNIKGTITDGTLDIEFPDYIVYLEWTRPPEYGKRPPIDVIMKWMEKKHILTTARNINETKSIAFLISRAIWRDGWDGRIIAGLLDGYSGTSPLDAYIDKQWENKWSDWLYNAITKELDTYFKD